MSIFKNPIVISILSALGVILVLGVFLLIGNSGWKHATAVNVLLAIGLQAGLLAYVVVAAPDPNNDD